MKRRIALGCMLAWFAYVLTGCASSLLVERDASVMPLPTMRMGPAAPTGDVQVARDVQAVIYIPNRERTRLTAQVVHLTVDADESLYEAIVRAQLDQLQNYVQLTGGQELQLQQSADAVEVSCGVATVNLSISARLLEPEALFMVRMALTNALTELSQVRYVSVLVEDREEGLDIAAMVPAGVLSGYPSGDVHALWNQLEGQRNRTEETEKGEFAKAAQLYFVSADGKYLLPEVRSVVLGEQSLAAYAQLLLDEMAKGSTAHPGAKKLVPPSDYFEQAPTLIAPRGTAYRLLELRFRPEVDDYLRVQNGTRGMMLASIAYTLTGFLPGLDGLVITVDGEPVLEAVDGVGRVLTFDNDWIARTDFHGYVGNYCRLYFPLQDGTALVAVDRPIAQRLTDHPRTLLRQLMLGPQPTDSHTALQPIMPEGMTDADVFGIERVDDTMLINLSEAFGTALGKMDDQTSRNWVYSVVNTLTELSDVQRVRFYINGEQREATKNGLTFSGEFLRHPGIIRWNVQ